MISYLIVFIKAFTICNYPLIGDHFNHTYLIMGDESYTLLISYYTHSIYIIIGLKSCFKNIISKMSAYKMWNNEYMWIESVYETRV